MSLPLADEPPEAVPDELEALQVDVDDGLAWVILDRPEKRNALNDTLKSELLAVLDALESAPGVRVVALRGAGGHFAGGADVTEFQGRSADEQREAMEGARLYDAVADLPLPVIAAIDGFCLGGGNELALACDVRVATTEARLGQPEINLGLIPGGGGTQRLPRVVGPGQARRLVLTGELIPGEEAREIGLVDVLVDPDDLEPAVEKMAGRMTSKSPVALAQAKEALQAADETPLEEGLARERGLFADLFDTADMQEGVSAFLEDRDPEWTGK